MVKVGDKVKDVVTGFTGIVVGRTEWLNKCVRVIVQPQELREGKPVDTSQFDEEQVKVLKSSAVTIKKENKTGGPKDFMPSQQTVSR